MKFLIAVLILFFCSCTFISSGKKRSRGSLSDAMGKASDKNKGSREVDSDDDDDDSSGSAWIFTSRDDDDDGYVPRSGDDERADIKKKRSLMPRKNYGYRFSLAYSKNTISLKNSSIPMNQFGLRYLSRLSDNNNSAFGAYLDIAATKISSSHKIQESLNKVSFFDIGLSYRAGLSKPYTTLGFFLDLNAGYSHFSWNYQNAIIADGEHISSDAVGAFDFSLGFGMQMFQDQSVGLSATIIPGVKLYGNETYEGFTEDFFGSSTYFRINFALEFGKSN